MSTEVDGTRSYVDIHEVVNNPALDVVHYPVHKVTSSNVHDFNIRKIPDEKRNCFKNYIQF